MPLPSGEVTISTSCRFSNEIGIKLEKLGFTALELVLALLSLPPDLVKRIVEQGGKNDLRRPLTTDVPRTGAHPDDPPMMYFQGLGWHEIPQREVHTPAEQNRIMDDAMT